MKEVLLHIREIMTGCDHKDRQNHKLKHIHIHTYKQSNEDFLKHFIIYVILEFILHKIRETLKVEGCRENGNENSSV